MSSESGFLGAVVQVSSGPNRETNVAQAIELVKRAAAGGASLIVLPELFTGLAPAAEVAAAAEPFMGPTSQQLAQLARQLHVTLVAGSLPEIAPTAGRYFNTSLVFGPNGELLGRYRKMHLFDVNLPGRVVYQESATVDAGNDICVVDTPRGRLGIAICYDLRFPELFRALVAAGAEILAVPSAFALGTGRDHWHTLIRARAIENQCYVLAANQVGRHSEQLTTYGRSLIVDPWGVELAQLADTPGTIAAPIDLAHLQRIRRELPALSHRRLNGRGE